MPKASLAPPNRAEFGDFIGAKFAWHQLCNADESGTAPIPLSGKIRHRPPPGPTKASAVPYVLGRQKMGNGSRGIHARLASRVVDEYMVTTIVFL